MVSFDVRKPHDSTVRAYTVWLDNNPIDISTNKPLYFRYKEEFRKLSEDERTSIGSENQKFLRDFDNETLQMEFHHLPQKPSRMEFHLVSIIAAVYPSF